MTDFELLKKEIKDNGLTLSFVAKKLGITRQGLYKKFDEGIEFKTSQMIILVDLLRLSEEKSRQIFFAEKVDY